MKAFVARLTGEMFNEGVQCCVCSTRCATPHGLLQHLGKHGAPPSVVEPLKRLRFAKDVKKVAAGRALVKASLSDAEAGNVAVDPTG